MLWGETGGYIFSKDSSWDINMSYMRDLYTNSWKINLYLNLFQTSSKICGCIHTLDITIKGFICHCHLSPKKIPQNPQPWARLPIRHHQLEVQWFPQPVGMRVCCMPEGRPAYTTLSKAMTGSYVVQGLIQLDMCVYVYVYLYICISMYSCCIDSYMYLGMGVCRVKWNTRICKR